MLKSVIYARFSSERQRATSIEDQVVLCREAALRFHCDVSLDRVFSDAEMSGAVEQRPGYLALMAAAKAGEFEAILVESQDRLWRDQGEMHHALKRLKFWGIRIFAVTAGIDLTEKTGSLLASVVGWKDEVFLQDLIDKTRRGMVGQIRRGLCAGGRAYGYQSEPVLDEARQVVGCRRVIDPVESDVVRRIFALYDQGMAPKAIAHRLNEKRVPPPRPRRGRKSQGWTWTTINGSPKKGIGILNNPLYVGRLVWNRSRKMRDPDTGKRVMRLRPPEEWITTNVPELRIIPEELWERVQERRSGRRHIIRGNMQGRHMKYLFSGLLVCGDCGSAYTIDSGKYYGCATHRNRGPAVCQNNRQVHRIRLEEALIRLVFEDVFSPQVVAYLNRKVDAALRRLVVAPDTPRERLAADLARAHVELDNVKAAILQGIVTPTTREMLEACERRVADLEKTLRTPPPPAKPVSLAAVVSTYLADLRAVLTTDVEYARILLEKLIGRVTLRRDGRDLVAETRGNLIGILGGELVCGLYGAGSPFPMQPSTVIDRRIVA